MCQPICLDLKSVLHVRSLYTNLGYYCMYPFSPSTLTPIFRGLSHVLPLFDPIYFLGTSCCLNSQLISVILDVSSSPSLSFSPISLVFSPNVLGSLFYKVFPDSSVLVVHGVSSSLSFANLTGNLDPWFLSVTVKPPFIFVTFSTSSMTYSLSYRHFLFTLPSSTFSPRTPILFPRKKITTFYR